MPMNPRLPIVLALSATLLSCGATIPATGAAAAGPGTRVPAIIVSPLAKKGFVDKTAYDTGSILRFITRRWNLEPLAGLGERDRALAAHGRPPMGDLGPALESLP